MGLLPAVTDVRFKLQPRPNAKLCLHRPWEPTPRLPGPASPSPGSLAGPRTLRRPGFPNSWAARVCRTAAAKVPTPGLTMSPGQVLRVHQADLLLPGDVTVQSDGEVVGRRNDLLGRQDHGARAAPEDTPVLAVRLLVAGKGVCASAPRRCRAGLAPAAVTATPSLPLPSARVGLAPHPHLVKRSQGLGPWPSSGVDQWQSILRMLLVRQVKVPAPGPGSSDRWEPTEAAAGREGGGEALEADTLTGRSPGNDSRRIHQGRAGRSGQRCSGPWHVGGTGVQAGPWRAGPSTVRPHPPRGV